MWAAVSHLAECHAPTLTPKLKHLGSSVQFQSVSLRVRLCFRSEVAAAGFHSALGTNGPTLKISEPHSYHMENHSHL